MIANGERFLVKNIMRFSGEFLFIRYKMPTVLRMRLLFGCKLSFQLLWLNSCAVRQKRMPHNVCKGHWEFRHNSDFIWQPAHIHIHVQMCLAGTSLYQRCLLPDKIPSTPNSPYQASVLCRTVPIFC